MATLTVQAKYDGQGIRKAKKDLTGFEKFAKDKMRIFSISSIAAATIAFAKVAGDAYMADEKAASNLAAQMRNLGLGYATSKNEEFIASLQKSSGILDDELRPAMLKFIATTRDVTVSQQLMQKAVDISAGTGKDLDTVVTALSRAIAGNRRGLLSLGTGLDAATIKSGTLKQILEFLSKYDGSNLKQVGTRARELADAQVIIADATEKVGYYITMGESNFVKGLGAIWGFIQQVDSHLQGKSLPTSYTGRYAYAKKVQTEAQKAETDRENRRASAQAKSAKVAKKEKTALDAFIDAKDKQAKAEKKVTVAKTKNLQLTRLEAKYNLELIGLSAAKSRNAGNAGVMGRLTDLTTIAQANAGLPVSASALAGAKNTQVPNIVINVHGSIVHQNDLVDYVSNAMTKHPSFGFGYGKWGGGL